MEKVIEQIVRLTMNGDETRAEVIGELVHCRDCKYRPVKEDPNGADYGFNLIYPDEENEICPCIISDGWYSWMPKDNWFCAYGERKEIEDDKSKMDK